MITFNRGAVPPYTVSFVEENLSRNPIQATVDRLLVGTNTLTFSGTTLPIFGSSSLTIDNTSTSQTDRGLVIGVNSGDNAVLTNSLPGGLNAQYATLGSAAGSSGTLNVTGPNNTFNVTGTGALNDLIVGLSGTGTINVSAGAGVNVAGDTALCADSTSTISVSGENSKWKSDGTLSVGGTLNVSSQGVVESAEATIDNPNPGMQFATATLDGMGSKWTVDGNFYIGRSGNGMLQISNGGTVEKIGSSLTSTYIGFLGGNGEATVSSGANWTNSQDLFVGASGTGTLTIQTGGTVSSQEVPSATALPARSRSTESVRCGTLGATVSISALVAKESFAFKMAVS